MKLVLIGGNSVTRLKGLIEKNADNVQVSTFNSTVDFIEQASMRQLYVDRLFLLEDSLQNLSGDIHIQLQTFANFIGQQFPQSRIFCLAKSENVLEQFASLFNSFNCLTLSLKHVTPTFINHITLLPIEEVMQKYKEYVYTIEGGVGGEKLKANNAVNSNSSQNTQPTTTAQSPKRGGLFGRGKNHNNQSQNVGNSPTAPLNQGGNSGTAAQPGGNFPGQSSSAPQSFEAGNAFAQGNNKNKFGKFNNTNVSSGGNPFDKKPEPSSGTEVQPVQQAEPQSGVEEVQNNEQFGAFFQNGINMGSNPFETQPQTNSFEPQGNNPFEPQQPAPQTGFDQQANNDPFAQQSGFAQQANNNPFVQQSGFDQQASQQNMFNQSDMFAKNNDAALNSGVNPFVENTQDDIEEVDSMPAPMPQFGQPTQPVQQGNPFGDSGGIDFSKHGSMQMEDAMGIGVAGAAVATGFSDSAPSSTRIDRSKLSNRGVQNAYDFRSAQNIQLSHDNTNNQAVEEVSQITAAPYMGVIDDSAYQQQFAPQVQERIVEKIVEKEVYIDSGTETPAQKLLDIGKQVVIVVTGDRRSGSTFAALSLAELYGKRIATLVVDLDSEHCGGQLYQDLGVLSNEEENVQHGAKRCRNSTLLTNLVHHDADANYDYLFSLVGNDPITDTEMRSIASSIVQQRTYQLVLIDCPWSHLNALEEVLMTAKVMIMVDPNISGCYNIINLLGELPKGGRIANAMERSGSFVAKQGTNPQELVKNMTWISDMFAQDGEINWGKRPVAGSADRQNLLDVMKKL